MRRKMVSQFGTCILFQFSLETSLSYCLCTLFSLFTDQDNDTFVQHRGCWENKHIKIVNCLETKIMGTYLSIYRVFYTEESGFEKKRTYISFKISMNSSTVVCKFFTYDTKDIKWVFAFPCFCQQNSAYLQCYFVSHPDGTKQY